MSRDHGAAFNFTSRGRGRSLLPHRYSIIQAKLNVGCDEAPEGDMPRAPQACSGIVINLMDCTWGGICVSFPCFLWVMREGGFCSWSGGVQPLCGVLASR